jgi:hypothetical protein
MAITTAQTEQIIIDRLGPLMGKAGMDNTTVDGTNTDLTDPIRSALWAQGKTVATITSPDPSGVTEYAKFLRLTEYFTLENIAGNLELVDIEVGPRSQKYNQLTQQVQDKIARLRKALREDGYLLQDPAVGFVELDFAGR